MKILTGLLISLLVLDCSLVLGREPSRMDPEKFHLDIRSDISDMTSESDMTEIVYRVFLSNRADVQRMVNFFEFHNLVKFREDIQYIISKKLPPIRVYRTFLKSEFQLKTAFRQILAGRSAGIELREICRAIALLIKTRTILERAASSPDDHRPGLFKELSCLTPPLAGELCMRYESLRRAVCGELFLGELAAYCEEAAVPVVDEAGWQSYCVFMASRHPDFLVRTAEEEGMGGIRKRLMEFWDESGTVPFLVERSGEGAGLGPAEAEKKSLASRYAREYLAPRVRMRVESFAVEARKQLKLELSHQFEALHKAIMKYRDLGELIREARDGGL